MSTKASWTLSPPLPSQRFRLGIIPIWRHSPTASNYSEDHSSRRRRKVFEAAIHRRPLPPPLPPTYFSQWRLEDHHLTIVWTGLDFRARPVPPAPVNHVRACDVHHKSGRKGFLSRVSQTNVQCMHETLECARRVSLSSKNFSKKGKCCLKLQRRPPPV
jgi:hypothetical protein